MGTSGDGTSWGTAFKTIQEAIDAASANDEIWVKQGTYSSSNLNNAVHIYGGFAGGETAREDRDWKTNVTTVDGTNTTRCFNVSANATIDGFTITNGDPGSDWGGGMYISGAIMPTIANCIFIGNTAQNGGGIAVGAYAIPTIINCTFSGNSVSNFGGGIFNIQSTPIITNCIFSVNQAFFNGGGGIANMNSNPTITNCTFWGNRAVTGGDGDGIHNISSLPTITNCILWNQGTSNPEIYDDSGSTSTVNYCDVEGGYSSGTGNINADPLLMDSGTGHFYLKTGSPCIDAGENAAVPVDITTDFQGEQRLFDDLLTVDTGSGAVPIVDMGADEYVDTDSDGLANFVESNSGVFNDPFDTGTDPNNPDTDGDGPSDGDEVNIYGTDPNHLRYSRWSHT